MHSNRRISAAVFLFAAQVILVPSAASQIFDPRSFPGSAGQAAREAQRELQRARQEEMRRRMEEQREARQAQQEGTYAERSRIEGEGCTKLKSWLSSAPNAIGARRMEEWLPLIDDTRFPNFFGKPYDQITIADFRSLDLMRVSCQRQGGLTPAEMQTVHQVLNQSVHPALSRLLVSSRSQQSEAQSLLAELDTLKATDDDLRRFEGVSSRLNALTARQAPDQRSEIQSKIDSTRERIALPVYAARVERVTANAQGVEGLLALSGTLEELARSGLSAGSLTPLQQQLRQKLDEVSVPLVNEERTAIAGLGRGLPALERGVAYYASLTNKYQRAFPVVPALDSVRRDLLSSRASTINSAQSDLLGEVKKARTEPEISAVLSRYLLDMERQGAARTVVSFASERTASLRRATENERVFGAQAGAPTAAAPQSSPAGRSGGGQSGVLSDPNELRKYEAGAIVRAIYLGDLSAMPKEDVLFLRVYLIGQARHLGQHCRTFTETEVQAHETRLVREVLTATQQNAGKILMEGMRKYVQIRDNPAVLADVAASDRRREHARDFAVRDVETLADSYGGCEAAVIKRYTNNLRNYLQNAR